MKKEEQEQEGLIFEHILFIFICSMVWGLSYHLIEMLPNYFSPLHYLVGFFSSIVYRKVFGDN